MDVELTPIGFEYDCPGLLEKLALSLSILAKHKVDILKALEYAGGKRDFDALVAQVVRGEVHLYPLPNSVIMAEIIRGAGKDIYHLFVVAGDLDEILAADEFLREQARANYCDVLALSGRRGWVKALRDTTWKEKSVYMETEI